MRSFGGREWRTERFGEPRDGAPLVILLAGGDELSEEFFAKLSAEGAPPANFAVPCDVDWDGDFTPWPADGSNGRQFSGGADEFGHSVAAAINALREELRPGAVYIVGYSLGGLAAIYFHLTLGLSDGCGSCSGSLWYPGWCEFLTEHPARGAVYLSLGGKEKNTRDPLMAANPEATERTKRLCLASAERVVFRNEPGSHFRDPDGRIARAIAWLAR